MVSPPDAEIVVVGAGPGGSVAAARLARRGCPVLLLEAAVFPRDKVCGDVLLPEIDGLLRRVGTSLDAVAPEACLLEGCRYVGARGRRAGGRFADGRGVVHPWRILPRRTLDARLAAWAARSGADLREGHRLLGVEWDPRRRLNRLAVATDDGRRTLTARLVLGADGAASRVARDRGLAFTGPGLDRGLCVGLRGYLDWPEEDRRATVFGDRDLLPGCAWIVPQPGGRANVGLGMLESDRRARGVALRRRFDRLLAEHAPAAGATGAPTGWRLPTRGLGRRPAADGVLLIGDAAGLIDPFTGHGIHNAMRSGLIAADIAARAVGAGDNLVSGGPLGDYRRLLARELGSELRLGSLLQRFHARPGWVDMALRRAVASERWADRFIGLAGHAISKREIVRPAFWLDFVRPAGGG